MARALSLTILILTGFFPSFSQRETVNQSTQWFTLASDIRVSKNYSVLAEGQFRYVNSFEPMQFQVRTGLDVHVSKHFSFVPLGYVYSWNPIYGNQPALYSNNEHRLFEQVIYKHEIGRFHLDYRVRLEQRFIQVHENNNGEVISKGYDLYLNRIRFRFMMKVPINQEKFVAGTAFVSLYDEIFLDFGQKVVYTDPDQNRIFAGIGYHFNQKVIIQAGFFQQTLIKLSGNQQENNIGLQLQVLCNLDFSKSP